MAATGNLVVVQGCDCCVLIDTEMGVKLRSEDERGMEEKTCRDSRNSGSKSTTCDHISNRRSPVCGNLQEFGLHKIAKK